MAIDKIFQDEPPDRSPRVLEAFQADLHTLEDQQLINKYYLSGAAFALDDNRHYALRQEVSAHFEVRYSEVFIVGSGKLGFSIKPRRRFQPFYSGSDIDIVIISTELFEKIWQEIFLFERNGGYWPNIGAFKQYHFQGWMRPDKLPLERSFTFTRIWWDFFEKVSGGGEYGPYKIRGGLYQSQFFFQSYQQKCFDQCRSALKKI